MDKELKDFLSSDDFRERFEYGFSYFLYNFLKAESKAGRLPENLGRVHCVCPKLKFSDASDGGFLKDLNFFYLNLCVIVRLYFEKGAEQN